MQDKPVKVDAYAGHRGEETPRAFFLDDERIEITRTDRSWIAEEGENRRRSRFFQVQGSDNRTHLLRYDEELNAWFHQPNPK